MRILLIDNHDSFTYNLAHDIAVVTGSWPDVVRNDDAVPTEAAGPAGSEGASGSMQRWLAGYDAVVVSPGPGTPADDADLGLSRAAVSQGEVPVLGVCLGHQAIAFAHGAAVGRAPAPVHGEVAEVSHGGEGLFAGLPDPLPMVRYHSLAVTDLPPELEVDAVDQTDGVIMALHHRELPLWGIQAHPESICSAHGRDLLRNFIQLARSWNERHRPDAASGRDTVGSSGLDTADVADGAEAGGVTEVTDVAEAADAVAPSAAEVADVTEVAGANPPMSAPAREEGGSRQVRRVLARSLPWHGDEQTLFDELFRGDDHAWWLDSALAGESGGRFSYLGSAAGPLARVATTPAHTEGVVVRGADGERTHSATMLDLVHRDLASAQVTVQTEDGAPVEAPFDFALGWVGYLGYEAGTRWMLGETADAPPDAPSDLPAHVSPDTPPDAVLVFADRAVAIDHRERRAWVLALLPPEEGALAATQRGWLRDTIEHLAGANPESSPSGTLASSQSDVPPPSRPDIAAPSRHEVPASSPPANPARTRPDMPAPPRVGALTLRHSRDGYLALIRRCLGHIAAGESYELCLTNRITAHADIDSWGLYRRLRALSPRPFAAYLAFGRTHVLSASPERFLQVSKGVVEAKPIKGTRPRGATPQQDEALAAELASDPKERAENLMIVDLLRNDLGRVCRVGSVHVPVLFDVETYEGVHQLVSTVRGDLAEGLTSVDAVRAAFPGGSMTGAPKERSVRLLRELEAGPRGVYAGALGYFSLSGDADWSIVIRSIVQHADRLTYGIGGAITARSDPLAEWRETLVKARTLGSALGLDLDTVLEARPWEKPREKDREEDRPE